MPDNKFELQKVPYMVDILKDLSPDSKIKTVTIMKHCSCGCTEMIIKNSVVTLNKTKGLYHA